MGEVKTHALSVTEPRYPVGTAILLWDRRARIISWKWSPVSGWWAECRFPNSLTHSIIGLWLVASVIIGLVAGRLIDRMGGGDE